MEWDHVYVLNVVDGSFPSEFATGKAEQIEEERRLLYVAMTRARNELTCVVPLRFQITSPRSTERTCLRRAQPVPHGEGREVLR